MTKKRKVLRAKWDKVIIKPIDGGEKMMGGLYIPDAGENAPEIGTVTHVGPGVMNVFGHFITMTCKIGDVVIIPKIGSFKLSHNGEDYYVTREQELLAEEVEEEYEED